MRILLIEDSEAMAAYIVASLQRKGYAVDHASCGKDGLRAIVSPEYDMAICDVGLPDMCGFDVVEMARAHDIHIPILFLSAMSAVDDRVKGLQVGGDDYLTKPFAFPELLARVQAQLRRACQSSEKNDELRVADLRLDLVHRKAYRDSQEILMQPLEFKLLQYLVRNEGQVLSKAVIMERMWDLRFNPDSNVVEVRMHYLRNKVDKPFRNKLIHTVRGIGYVLENRQCSA